MELYQVAQLLRRSYPMLLLDGVTSVEAGLRCEAFKNVTYNEWFFPVHFPSHPIMPGSLQIEAFAQAVAIPLLSADIQTSDRQMPITLAGVDKVRFYKELRPGTKFEISVSITRIAMQVATALAVGKARGRKISECEITYKLHGDNHVR